MNVYSCRNCQNMICSHAQIEGSIHRQQDRPCEDAVFHRFTDRYLFYGLADGQSGTACGAEGGQACLEAISDYIDSAGMERFLDTPFRDELPCGFVQVLRRKLSALADGRGMDLKEFSSTFLAIAIDLKTGKYMLLHLGDGCAIGIPHTGDPFLLSEPENGLTSCHTWLTTSANAVTHFRVAFGSLDAGKRLILLSDGATCFCRGRNIPWRAKELMKNGSRQQLQECLLQSDPSDDATCIVLDICG